MSKFVFVGVQGSFGRGSLSFPADKSKDEKAVPKQIQPGEMVELSDKACAELAPKVKACLVPEKDYPEFLRALLDKDQLNKAIRKLHMQEAVRVKAFEEKPAKK